MSEQTDLEAEQAEREQAVADQALAVIQPVQPRAFATTAAQAKVDAVANLTMKAYERAATLQITAEESAALQADFPDEAFKPGAAGKEQLIYLEHPYLRDRMNQVFGLGQWAIVPRNRWAEEFRTANGKEASRVYVEAMLVVRGCFVGEAVGDMVYYKTNDSQNYGDAVEGAKTAAFRRCAKEFGVGLQAWKKDWCLGWWKRRNAPQHAHEALPPSAQPPANKVAPAANQGPTSGTATPVSDRPKLRMATLNKLKAAPGQPNRGLVTRWAMAKGWITGEDELEKWPVMFLPKSEPALLEMLADVQKFEVMTSEQQPAEQEPTP